MYYKIKKMLIDMLKFNLITATQRKFRLSYRSQYKKNKPSPQFPVATMLHCPPHSTTKPHISIESSKTHPPDYNHHQLVPHYLHRADNNNDGRQYNQHQLVPHYLLHPDNHDDGR